MLRAKLRVVATGVEDVWKWQGDGADEPASLSCPVVMSADTCRGLVTRADALSEAWRVYNDACEDVFIFAIAAHSELKLAQLRAIRSEAREVLRLMGVQL